jgi:DNA invertase Pin-like site-specific DNA recombinase
MKVVGYGRCSTAEQASNGVSIEVQLRAVERVAETNGWEMTWLADEGVSGAVPPESRKRFKAALALLEAGESEALIFHQARPRQPLHRGLRPPAASV